MTGATAPRLFVTGIDNSGRSCVVKEVPVSAEMLETEGFRHATLHAASVPPSPRPEGRGGLLDVGLSPGEVRWSIVDYRPNQSYPVHHTDSVDFDIVLDGSLELQLDDGAHPLNLGDCVIVAGVDHAWKSGPEGCRLSVVMVATPTP